LGLNTTELIKHWTMQGAAPGVGERFRSTAGMLAVADDAAEPPSETPDALRMRRSDEEEWRPLLTAAGDR
jgi:hypothetical protein